MKTEDIAETLRSWQALNDEQRGAAALPLRDRGNPAVQEASNIALALLQLFARPNAAELDAEAHRLAIALKALRLIRDARPNYDREWMIAIATNALNGEDTGP